MNRTEFVHMQSDKEPYKRFFFRYQSLIYKFDLSGCISALKKFDDKLMKNAPASLQEQQELKEEKNMKDKIKVCKMKRRDFEK